MLPSSIPAKNSPSFVHLRCHSEYSIVDGIVRFSKTVSSNSPFRLPSKYRGSAVEISLNSLPTEYAT